MVSKPKNIISRNDIVRWARSQEELTEGLQIRQRQPAGVQFAQMVKERTFELYLIAVRSDGKDALTASRVQLCVLRASNARLSLVDGRTELVIRNAGEADESWRVKLRSACVRMGVDPKFVDELGTSGRPKAGAPPAQNKEKP